jgi:uncharacterized protein (TIGR02001 family)
MISQKTKFIFAGSLFLVFFNFVCERSVAQTRVSESKSSPSLAAAVSFTSNHIEKGLTQTAQEPAAQAKLGLNYPSGFLGLWGSNVKFVNEDIHFNYRILGHLRFDLTSGVDLTAGYKYSRYMSNGSRNGNIWSLDLNLYSWHCYLENEDNFEGLKKNRYWFAFGKEWPLWGLFLSGTLGYSMIQAEGYTNFFDSQIVLVYRWTNSSISLGTTATSTSQQFSDRSKNMFFFKLEAQFY